MAICFHVIVRNGLAHKSVQGPNSATKAVTSSVFDPTQAGFTAPKMKVGSIALCLIIPRLTSVNVRSGLFSKPSEKLRVHSTLRAEPL